MESTVLIAHGERERERERERDYIVPRNERN
jgi:hypothetical protein